MGKVMGRGNALMGEAEAEQEKDLSMAKMALMGEAEAEQEEEQDEAIRSSQDSRQGWRKKAVSHAMGAVMGKKVMSHAMGAVMGKKAVSHAMGKVMGRGNALMGEAEAEQEKDLSMAKMALMGEAEAEQEEDNGVRT